MKERTLITACLFTVVGYFAWLMLVDRIKLRRRRREISLKEFLENHKEPVTIVWLKKKR